MSRNSNGDECAYFVGGGNGSCEYRYANPCSYLINHSEFLHAYHSPYLLDYHNHLPSSSKPCPIRDAMPDSLRYALRLVPHPALLAQQSSLV